MKKLFFFSALCVQWLFTFAQFEIKDTARLFELSFEELMQVEVVTATNRTETLSDAPATMIVLSKQEISERGYIHLYDIFDDLPGMDVTKAYGDTYYKNYWRGYRNTIGCPYLVMVDGVVQNDMYFSETVQTMIVMPITHVNRIEIVYGPASSVYGANAFMGVINVITENKLAYDGTKFNAFINQGFNTFNNNHVSAFLQKNKLRLSINAHFETGDLRDFVDNSRFYWLRDQHYADTLLWGDFVNNSRANTGKFSSRMKNRSYDIRLFFANTEIGSKYLFLDPGYGLVFPGDRMSSNCNWPQYVHDFYIRHTEDFSNKLTSRTLFRYRRDGITNDGFDMEAYNVTNNNADSSLLGGILAAPGESVRVIAVTSWQSLNWGLSFFEDLEYKFSSSLSFAGGYKYEYKNLQKAYDIITAPLIFPGLVDASDPIRYPSASIPYHKSQNRMDWYDQGFYLQSNYRLNNQNIFHLGARRDYNSAYGAANTFRASYVNHFKKFTFKAMYGEAFQEPVPRNLYGGWTGSGSDPELKPERSRNLETNIHYATSNFQSWIGLYRVQTYNSIITYTGGAKNAGNREVIGLDLYVFKNFPLAGFRKLNAWAYYSTIFKEEEEKFDAYGNSTGYGSIGDLAHHKIFAGLTAIVNKYFSVNLRNRYFSQRATVSTNPFRTIDGYLTTDANIMFTNILMDGFNIALKIDNVFDAKYFHTGLREADSGETPGTWDGYAFNGSKGWYNSLLPQPHRFFLVSIRLDF